jgi:chromosome segregation ATPase
MYNYNPLWLSLRSTLWMWALTIFGCAVVVIWRRPKVPAHIAAPALAVRLRPEFLKSFVDAYEEKRKAILELESLENRVQKGRIPRRRYKVQRKTLETRVGTLSRNLAELREKMHAAGGQYAELMRQLEIAETELNEVEANIKSIEARHSRGELSLEAYRKLLSDYQRRKERTNTSISGILLRLREEIR